MPDTPEDLRRQADKSRSLGETAFSADDKVQFAKLAHEFDRRADELEAASIPTAPSNPPPAVAPRRGWLTWLMLAVGLIVLTIALGAVLAVVGWIIGAVLAVVAATYAWLSGARKDG